MSNPPAQAEYFKIRILNSQQENDPLGLTGAVTLTYADGSPVHAKLSNIAPGATSEYVELPYGAYQFKLFATNGMSIDVTKQFSELPVQPDYQVQQTTSTTTAGLYHSRENVQAGRRLHSDVISSSFELPG